MNPTVEEIEKAIRQVAMDNPTFTYLRDEDDTSPCRYAPTPGNPEGCIINAGLARLGIQMPFEVEGQPVGMALPKMGLPWSGWLDTVQMEQDNGATWGDAVKMADEVCGG